MGNVGCLWQSVVLSLKVKMFKKIKYQELSRYYPSSVIPFNLNSVMKEGEDWRLNKSKQEWKSILDPKRYEIPLTRKSY